MRDDSELIGIAEAAYLLGQPYRKAWDAAATRQLGEVHRIGGRVFVERAVVERVQRERSEQSPAGAA